MANDIRSSSTTTTITTSYGGWGGVRCRDARAFAQLIHGLADHLPGSSFRHKTDLLTKVNGYLEFSHESHR